MSRKKKHEEHANHERWLVSYADFITLLFAFFVVLFSSSQVDRSKSNKMALAMQAAFSQFSIFSKGGGNLSLITAEGRPNTSMSTVIPGAEGAPIFMPPAIMSDDMAMVSPQLGDPSLNMGSGVPTTEEEALKRAQQDIFSFLDKKKVEGGVSDVTRTFYGVVITLGEDGMFLSGSDQLTPGSKDILTGLGEVLRHVPNQIRVNGHTDNSKGKGSFGTNWELSTARATQVVKWLIGNYNMDPSRFAAVGYGEYRPVTSNDTEEGRKKNRRVEVVILTDKSSEQEDGITGQQAKVLSTEPMPFPPAPHENPSSLPTSMPSE
jgi:chemotaxis protein MotB